jgi:hypothetical protein
MYEPFITKTNIFISIFSLTALYFQLTATIDLLRLHLYPQRSFLQKLGQVGVLLIDSQTSHQRNELKRKNREQNIGDWVTTALFSPHTLLPPTAVRTILKPEEPQRMLYQSENFSSMKLNLTSLASRFLPKSKTANKRRTEFDRTPSVTDLAGKRAGCLTALELFLEWESKKVRR